MAVARLGKDCELRIEDVLVTHVRDLTIRLSSTEADITTRASQGWTQRITSLREASLEFSLLDIPDDPILGILRAAYVGSGTAGLIEVAAGGIKGRWSVSRLTREEPLNGAVRIFVTLLLAELIEVT